MHYMTASKSIAIVVLLIIVGVILALGHIWLDQKTEKNIPGILEPAEKSEEEIESIEPPERVVKVLGEAKPTDKSYPSPIKADKTPTSFHLKNISEKKLVETQIKLNTALSKKAGFDKIWSSLNAEDKKTVVQTRISLSYGLLHLDNFDLKMTRMIFKKGSFGFSYKEDTLTVVQTYRGFSARDKLKVGDIIKAVGGDPVEPDKDLRTMLYQLSTKVVFTIERNHEEIDVILERKVPPQIQQEVILDIIQKSMAIIAKQKKTISELQKKFETTTNNTELIQIFKAAHEIEKLSVANRGKLDKVIAEIMSK